MSALELLPNRMLAQGGIDAGADGCASVLAAEPDGVRCTKMGDHGAGRVPAGRRIVGLTRDGKPFRPGDWAERLAGVITLFVKEKRPGSSVAATWLAVPFVKGGARCLSVSPQLAEVCPEAFDFVMRFASDNELVVEADE